MSWLSSTATSESLPHILNQPGLTIWAVLLCVIGGAGRPCVGQVVIAPAIMTVAGDATNHSAGSDGDNVSAMSATLNAPLGIAFDSSGNLYIADTNNNAIRKVDAVTGKISNVSAGTLNKPRSVVVDTTDNLYIADTSNNRIIKVDLKANSATIFAGLAAGKTVIGDKELAVNARFNTPSGIALDRFNNLYIADQGNNQIRKVDALTLTISTVVGTGKVSSNALESNGDNGPAVDATLNQPRDLSVDKDGNLYIMDTGNNKIRKVDVRTNVITTLAGSGTSGYAGDGLLATDSKTLISAPGKSTMDSFGNLYFSDAGNNCVRKIEGKTGVITTVAGDGTAGSTGDGGVATKARLNFPYGVALDALGNLYIADSNNNVIRKLIIQPTNFPPTVVEGFSTVQTIFLLTTAPGNISISLPQSQNGISEYSLKKITGCTLNAPSLPGTVCAVTVMFHPAYPGQRSQLLLVKVGIETVIFPLNAMGVGPLPVLRPGVANDGNCIEADPRDQGLLGVQ